MMEECCRTCAALNNTNKVFTNIFTRNELKTVLLDYLQDWSLDIIIGDSLPQVVCGVCEEILIKIGMFREVALKAQESFKVKLSYTESFQQIACKLENEFELREDDSVEKLFQTVKIKLENIDENENEELTRLTADELKLSICKLEKENELEFIEDGVELPTFVAENINENLASEIRKNTEGEVNHSNNVENPNVNLVKIESADENVTIETGALIEDNEDSDLVDVYYEVETSSDEDGDAVVEDKAYQDSNFEPEATTSSQNHEYLITSAKSMRSRSNAALKAFLERKRKIEDEKECADVNECSDDKECSDDEECSVTKNNKQVLSESLLDILHNSKQGNILLLEQKDGLLPSNAHKTALMKIILKDLEDLYHRNNCFIKNRDFEVICREITKIFPNEPTDYYFIPRNQSRRNPGGRLYHRYHSLRTKYKRIRKKKEDDNIKNKNVYTLCF